MPSTRSVADARFMNVIEVSHLTKRYGDRAAVDGVSFSVEEGEIFGILGPNGAGKTTTVESIVGLRTPDSGTIRVLGLDPGTDRDRLARRRRRPAPGERAARPDDRPRGARALRLVLRRPGGSAPSSWTTWASTDKRDTAYRHLSGGQKQRLSIALALVGQPQDRDPRRAVDRPRPAGASRHLGPHRVDPRPRRHRRPRHPPDGGGRAARRSGRGDPRRPGGRARHAGGHRLDGRPGAAAPLPTVGADRGPAADGSAGGAERRSGPDRPSSSPGPATSSGR